MPPDSSWVLRTIATATAGPLRILLRPPLGSPRRNRSSQSHRPYGETRTETPATGKKYVAIAGNIGVGKSSLTKVLSDYFKWEAFYEQRR